MHVCWNFALLLSTVEQSLAQCYELRYMADVCASLFSFIERIYRSITFLVCRNFRITSDSSLRFRNYCHYAFGVPFLMTSILIVLDSIEIEQFESFRPNFGLKKCMISADHIELFFLIIPSIVINVFTLIFVVMAALNCYKRSTSDNGTGYTRLNSEKERLVMILKLVGFIAVIWSFEYISHFIRIDEFVVTDICNCLQGVAIFIIFVLNKNTRVLIVKIFNSSHEQSETHESEEDENEKDFRQQ